MENEDVKKGGAEEGGAGAKKPAVGGLAGVSAGDSKIATVGLGNGLNYRGYNIEELAKHSTFEEVFYLLLHEKLPNEEEL